jgi:hypothetical protein
MTLSEQFNRLGIKDLTISKKILFKIVDDLTDRAGLDNYWWNMDEEIREEILTAWLAIIKQELNGL